MIFLQNIDKKEENWTKDYFVRRSNQIFSDREPDEEFPEPYNFEEEIPSDEEEQLMKEQEENELREAQKFLQQDAVSDHHMCSDEYLVINGTGPSGEAHY